MIVFGAPSRYIQGPGCLSSIGGELLLFGARAVLVVDAGIQQELLPVIQASCDAAAITLKVIPFSGESSPEGIDTLERQTGEFRPDIVVAAGGGKCIDSGKALGNRLGSRVATVPTIASNDSPTSHIYVLYDANHRLLRVEALPRNPDLVLVDTEVILRAPPVFLLAGIGDCVVKKFEVEACVQAHGRNVFGSKPSIAALSMARGAYEILRSDSASALESVAQHRSSDAFERVVEACVLLSGLSFENGGLCIAHAMTRGLSMVKPAADALHGLQVAYGVTVQLILEERDDQFLADHAAFYRKVGLPLTLEGLGQKNPSADVLDLIAEKTLAAPHMANFPAAVSHQQLTSAMRRAEQLFK